MLPGSRCKYCRVRFSEEERAKGLKLHTECIGPYAESFAARQARKRVAKQKQLKALEAREIRERKKALKTRGDWIKEAQAAVNKYVRLRDIAAGRGCISCGAKPAERFGGAMDAGHWRSVGSAPHLRFFLPQIRLQCVKCNRYLGGNAVEFRRGLVAVLGEARVQEIEVMQAAPKWTADYLQRLKRVMTKKARRIERHMQE